MKSHRVSNTGGLARSQRGNCQEGKDRDSLWEMPFQGVWLDLQPLAGEQNSSWVPAADQVFTPSCTLCVWDPVDRSGDGTAGSVHQSCYRNISPCSSLTCSSWCAAGSAFCPRESSEGSLSTQPQQWPSSHTVGVLVQNAWSGDAPRVDGKLGMVLLTCKKKILTFFRVQTFHFPKKKKNQRNRQLLLTNSYVATSISYNPLDVLEVQKPQTGWKVFGSLCHPQAAADSADIIVWDHTVAGRDTEVALAWQFHAGCAMG